MWTKHQTDSYLITCWLHQMILRRQVTLVCETIRWTVRFFPADTNRLLPRWTTFLETNISNDFDSVRSRVLERLPNFYKGQPYLWIIAKPAKNSTILKTRSNLEVLLFSMIFFTSSFLYIWVEKITERVKRFCDAMRNSKYFYRSIFTSQSLLEKWQLRQVEQRYFISFKTINKHTFSKNSVHTRERQLHEQSLAWACKTHNFQWAWKLL